MDKEPEVDPYFSDALKSGDRTRIAEAVREYLGMYLNPSTLSKLVIVSEEFFFKDDRTEDYRYIPTYQDDGSRLLDVGTIILNIDTAETRWHGEESKIFHDILIFALAMEYIMDHPEDKRYNKAPDGWSWNKGLHGLLQCLNRDILHRNYGSSELLILYIAPDLSAVYSNHGFYEAKVIKYLSEDRIVLHHHQLDHHVTFAIRHHYQPQEYDKLEPAQIEEKLKGWNIDDIIRTYDLGHSKWMTRDVFASTFAWADDGLVYALRVGDDELFSAFLGSNPQRLLQIISGDELSKVKLDGKEVLQYFKSGDAFVSNALGRHNQKFDGLFLRKPLFTAEDLTILAAKKRYDLLLKVPINNLDISNPSFNHGMREDFFETLGDIRAPEEVPELAGVIETYWPIFKQTVPKLGIEGVSDETVIVRGVKNLVDHGLGHSDPYIYWILKKIDPASVKEWILTIGPSEWSLFRSDEMYEELNEIKPITDDDIGVAIRAFFDTDKTRKKTGRQWAGFGRGSRTLDVNRLNPALKKRFLTINKEKQIWADFGYDPDDF